MPGLAVASATASAHSRKSPSLPTSIPFRSSRKLVPSVQWKKYRDIAVDLVGPRFPKSYVGCPVPPDRNLSTSVPFSDAVEPDAKQEPSP